MTDTNIVCENSAGTIEQQGKAVFVLKFKNDTINSESAISEVNGLVAGLTGHGGHTPAGVRTEGFLPPARGTTLIVDLSNMQFIGTDAFAPLVAANKKLQLSGGKMILADAQQKDVRDKIDTLGVGQVFDYQPDKTVDRVIETLSKQRGR